MAVYLSIDGGTTFTAGPEINTYSTSTLAVSGNGTLAAVISSYTGELWLPHSHFVLTLFFSPTYGTPEAITVTVNYDDGTLLPIYSDSGLTQPLDNPFSLNLTTLTIDFYVAGLSSYYNVVLTGGNIVGTVTIDENGG